MRGSVIYLVIILILCGAVYYLYNQKEKHKENAEMNWQNTIALKDSLIVAKNKIGVLEYSKAAYVTTTEGLINLNKELEEELKSTSGKVHYLNKALLKYEGGIQTSSDDTISNEGDSVYGVNWMFKKKYNKDNYRYLRGLSKFVVDFDKRSIKPLNTTLLRDDFVFTVSSGLRTRNDIIENFMSIPLEGVSVEDLNGVVLRGENNPLSTKSSTHKFSLGLYAGYGLGYDFSKNEWFDGLQIGTGINYQFNLF
jgi:cbb3-type cytochrome oxidase subunit 3